MKNRDFKFRCWDTAKGNWEHKFHYFSLEPKGMIGLTVIPIDREDRYIIQQFTGLRDAKYKDIYEGDVLLSQTTQKQSPVLWVSENDGYDYSGWRCDATGYGKITSGDVIVIGNILENPELLKQS